MDGLVDSILPFAFDCAQCVSLLFEAYLERCRQCKPDSQCSISLVFVTSYYFLLGAFHNLQ
jgi:hypothetical protein